MAPEAPAAGGPPPALWARGLSRVGRAGLGGLAELGAMSLFLGRALRAGLSRPWRLGLWLEQAEFVGFGSLFIVGLTGLFTGAVFTLQSVGALAKVGMESMVGSTVWLATSRELGPVLASLMVAGRVGSAMATELGTMRVSEQIDAMEVMAVDPMKYLVGPRILAAALMMPCMCLIFDAVAAAGAYLVAVPLMGIDEGAYAARIGWFVNPLDFVQGALKALVFGVAIATIGCFKGFTAEGGARGVGQATTQTVVVSSISVFALDYVMTSLFLRLNPIA